MCAGSIAHIERANPFMRSARHIAPLRTRELMALVRRPKKIRNSRQKIKGQLSLGLKTRGLKNKKGQLALALSVIFRSCVIGPVPTAPGGWGLRNPEPKEPGQRSSIVIASHGGMGLTEIGRFHDFANNDVSGLRSDLKTLFSMLCFRKCESGGIILPIACDGTLAERARRVDHVGWMTGAPSGCDTTPNRDLLLRTTRP